MIFRNNSEKHVQKSVQNARESRDRLMRRLAEARSTVELASGALQAAARDGADDAALGAGEAKLHEAETRASTLAPALAETLELVERLERELSHLAETKQRGETAAAIERYVRNLENSAELFNAAMAALVESASHAAIVTRDADGLKNFASHVLVEVPPVITMTIAMLRRCASEVVSGAAAAAMPTAETPFVHKVPLVPTTTRVFTSRAISWTDAAGQLRLCQRYQDADLPPGVAERALKAGICLTMDNPARRKFRGSWPGHPDPSNVTHLDPVVPEIVELNRNVTSQLGITEIIGKPYTARISTGSA